MSEEQIHDPIMKSLLDRKEEQLAGLHAEVVRLNQELADRGEVVAAQRRVHDELIEQNRQLKAQLEGVPEQLTEAREVIEQHARTILQLQHTVAAVIDGEQPEYSEVANHMLRTRAVLREYYLRQHLTDEVAKAISDRLDLGLVLEQGWDVASHKRECVQVIHDLMAGEIEDAPSLCTDEAKSINERLGLGMDFARHWQVYATFRVSIELESDEQPDPYRLTQFVEGELHGYRPYDDDGEIEVDIYSGPHVEETHE